jgi:hypothetical protein
MTQKTWTDLLGNCQPGDHVSGRYWVRPGEGRQRRVLWTFGTERQAEESFQWWQRGQ